VGGGIASGKGVGGAQVGGRKVSGGGIEPTFEKEVEAEGPLPGKNFLREKEERVDRV